MSLVCSVNIAFLVCLILLASLPFWGVSRVFSSSDGTRAERARRVFVYGMLCGVGAYVTIAWLSMMKHGLGCGLYQSGDIRQIFQGFFGNLDPSNAAGAMVWIMLPLLVVYLYMSYSSSSATTSESENFQMRLRNRA